MDFPIYRKYKDIEVWFRINSESKFDEIKKIGSKTIVSTIEATIYPEKQFINDMINCHEGRWRIIKEFEYNLALTDIIKPVK